MTSRQARKERREQERKARKAAYRAGLEAVAASAPLPELPLEEEFTPEFLAHARAVRERVERRLADAKQTAAPGAQTAESAGFVSQTAPAPGRTRSEINRANAAHSTGPRSSTGKLASSRNSLKHGLASGTLIIPGEDPAAFESLLESLLAEHQPANTTEEILIQEMARSYWLTQRALGFQNECFSAEGIDEKRLALFLRYQTTHERAFHKALNMLIRLQKERRRAERTDTPGFVSQHTRTIGAERLDEPVDVTEAKTQSAFVPQAISRHSPSFAQPGRIPPSTRHV